MDLNNHGKTTTIFAIIAAVLLFSLTASAVFYLQKEREGRERAELRLEKIEAALASAESELAEIKKQKFLLEEKNKEMDERINSLLDDLDLEKGLREELKSENIDLKESLAKAIEERDKFKNELSGIKNIDTRITQLQGKLTEQLRINQELQEKYELAVKRNESLQGYARQIEDQVVDDTQKESIPAEGIQLDEIVVIPDIVPEGRILSVDKETEFVIVNLGSKDGLEPGKLMSVYRGKDYLGDVRVTRVQSEMSAADFIPPFSSRLVRKNDQVVVKQ